VLAELEQPEVGLTGRWIHSMPGHLTHNSIYMILRVKALDSGVKVPFKLPAGFQFFYLM
jgi:hypothetical protein